MADSAGPAHDLAVVIVSANDAEWLPACLSTLRAHAGDIAMDVVVVDNGCTDGTARVVEEEFPGVRLLSAENRGFAAGNNRALPTCSARYILFLNPDTEIREGTFEDLLRTMDSMPDVGLLGCRHLMPDGGIQKTIRRFPGPSRVWGEALATGKLPLGLARLGELVLEDDAYDSERDCDWVAGSFMLIRAEALAGTGYLDERFFLYSEETDFCLRVGQGGWRVRYSPKMSILHHAGKAGVNAKLLEQSTYARRQYAEKHLGPVRRRLFAAGLAFHYLLRSAAALGTPAMRRQHAPARRCLSVSLGLRGSPFPALTPVAVDRVDWPEGRATHDEAAIKGPVLR